MNAQERQREAVQMFRDLTPQQRQEFYQRLNEYLYDEQQAIYNELMNLADDFDPYEIFVMASDPIHGSGMHLDEIIFRIIRRGVSIQSGLALFDHIRTVLEDMGQQPNPIALIPPYQHYISEDDIQQNDNRPSVFEIAEALGLPPPRHRAFQQPFQLVPPPQVQRRRAPVAQQQAPHNGNIALPNNATNTVSLEAIEFPQEMVDFHGERGYGRYYTQNTFNRLNPRLNPITRQPIRNTNIRRYRAVAQAQAPQGGRKRTRKATRKQRKTRRSRR